MTRAIVLAGLALLLGAAPAGAWTSSRFTSPSGNIRCVASNLALTCATNVPRRSVTLYRWARPVRGHGWLPRRGPVLRYGDYADNDSFSCYSAQDGIDCESLYSGHGFWIAREGLETW